MITKFKKVISTCLAIILLLGTAVIAPITASAAQTQAVSTGETSGEFEYYDYGDGTAEITGYTGSATELTIPSELDGKKVTSIGDDAFSYCTSLTSITIPDSVTEIGYAAFENTAWYDNQPDGVVYAGKVLYTYKGEMPQNTTITVKDGTKGIGDSAFRGCTSLEGITIPDSVTSISDYAFYDCTSLSSITIPDSVTSIGEYAFVGCTGLTSITIPDSVTSIGGSAFEGCTSLTSVTITDSVTEIGYGAFRYCTSLASITIPDSVTEIYEGAFFNTAWYGNQPDGVVYAGKVLYTYKGEMPENTTITVKDGTKSISNDAFSGCTCLASITIPDSVTKIGRRAFYSCTSLASITIPDSVTSIDERAFVGCTSLTSVTIPDSVTEIGYYAFGNCTSLTSITIPDSVTEIGGTAFEGCTSLKEITIPESVTEIGYAAFENTAWYNNQPDGVVYAGKVLYTYKGEMPQNTTITVKDGTKGIGGDAFIGCTNLTSITIPDSVTSIGDSSFRGCTNLEGITIPDSVTEIGYGVFYGCTSLTSITIPDSVTRIGDYAFYDCTSLASITIPDSVTSIGYYAFYYCTSLTSITIPASVKYIGDRAFGYYYDIIGNYVKTDGFKISGYKGSAAESYANKNGFEFISLGEAPTTEPTEPATVITDKDTNVSVEGDIPEGVELNVESAEAVVENAVAAYNITLEKDGKAVQPDGKVTVKLPVPDGVDGSQCKVYYIDGDEKSDMNAVFVDGYLVFETDHFSVYAVVKTEKTSVLLGDVNGDGKVNIKDATTIQKSAASLVTLTDEQNKAADVNKDGKVNVNDATAIQKYTADIDTGLDIGK